MEQEKNAYILGTEREELHRLGVQHQVWVSETVKSWELAGFNTGDTILDLGSGPGFCSKGLAYLVGDYGKVIAVDKSEAYINFIKDLNKIHGFNIECVLSSFDDLELEPESLDGVYCRWALAWIPNPEEIVEKVSKALKPGGTFISHEYFDWGTFQTQPEIPAITKGIKAILQSFFDSEGRINIGREMPAIFTELGLDVVSARPMTKMATPDNLTWSWPETFLNIYLPKLIGSGLITEEEVNLALEGIEDLSENLNSIILTPYMIEVIGLKK